VAKLMASKSNPSSAFSKTVTVQTKICTTLIGEVASKLRGSLLLIDGIPRYRFEDLFGRGENSIVR
jgi:hypothetical protein